MNIYGNGCAADKWLEHADLPDNASGVVHIDTVGRDNLWISQRERTYVAVKLGSIGPVQRRVWRAIDIAHELRRHGRVVEFAVTDDNYACAVCEPFARTLTVAIHSGPSPLPWHPTDITQRGLGGSETSAWRLAVALARTGCLVDLYGEFPEQGLVGDVMLRHHSTFDPTDRRDVVLGFRNARMFDEASFAERNLLWLTDVAGNEGLTPRNLEHIDRVLTVSEWHRRNVLETHPWIDPDQVVALRNGIWPAFFTSKPAPERERRVIYSSSPDRGLDILLNLWPLVREQVPDAELVCTYPPYYDAFAQRYPQLCTHKDMVAAQLASLEDYGVTRIEGGISQPRLAHLMRSSMVWAHPSYSTPQGERFHETSCIGAMEAQAAGLVQVCGAWGALPETAPSAFLIDGDPASEQWQKAAADAIVLGLTDPALQAAAQTIGPDHALALDWTDPADRILQLADA